MKNVIATCIIISLSGIALQADQPKPTTPKQTVQISAPVSMGDFFDKLTILMIKRERVTDLAKLENINKEYDMLMIIYANNITPSPTLESLINQLVEVNRNLWDLEDAVREKERDKNFDKEFIKIALSIPTNNDTRFEIKRAINKLLGSSIIEEKSYTENLAKKSSETMTKNQLKNLSQ